MAKYSGMSAIQASTAQGYEIYHAQLREMERKMILHHQKEKTWLMPEYSYERHMFESWLDSPDLWRYGFNLEWLEVSMNISREERIKMIEEYKEVT